MKLLTFPGKFLTIAALLLLLLASCAKDEVVQTTAAPAPGFNAIPGNNPGT
jgi:hypothetical protein